MKDKNQEKQEEIPVIPSEEICDKEQALLTMRLLEKGTRQAFLDGELGVKETSAKLDQINQAKKRCQAGDVSACRVLSELLDGLMGAQEK